MKRAIVIGATGAIGTALIKELVNHEIEVLVITREDSERNDNIPVHKQVTRKYCALNNLTELVNDTGKSYDVLYYFAWMGAAGPGRHDMYLQNENVKYALDAVALAKRFGCNFYIGAGSQAEYGRSDYPLTSETPTFPEMGYGYAKLCAGLMTREYAHQLGLSHVWVRVLSVYGPNDGAQSMIMSTIDKLLNNETPVFTKGEQLWDYLNSSDAAAAFRLIGEKGIDGKIYVLGSGVQRSLSEYIMDIISIVSPSAEVEFGSIPYGEKQVMYLCADITELQKDTGWYPKVEFKEGIREILKGK